MIYGMGTIVPRVLNFALLAPFYTRIFPVKTGEYGMVTELYAYMSILLILLTYGMETAFFRFATRKDYPVKTVFDTAVFSLLTTSLTFLLFVSVFYQKIADLLLYSGHPEYIIMFSLIVAIDAFTAIPFAKLRIDNQVFRFAAIKMVNVIVIVIVAFSFLYFIPNHLKSNPDSVWGNIYNENMRVGYVFIANLCGTVVSLLLLAPNLKEVRLRFNFSLLKQMLTYALPLLIAGLTGVIIESFDKISMKFLLPDEKTALQTLSIYGANYKIAVLMGLFIQMFRYAAEPFFFSKAKDKNAKGLYSRVMDYFVLFCLVIFLGITLNIDIFKYLIDQKYTSGLAIVPVILLSYVFMGIFVNLSIWYKLNDITRYGAVLTLIGAVITIGINVIFVSSHGYMASAWGHFFSYLFMIIVSYLWGRKIYPVKYNVLKIIAYFSVAVGIYYLSHLNPFQEKFPYLVLNNLLILIFVAVIYFREVRGKLSEIDNM